jgi:predicted transcriptional regulator
MRKSRTKYPARVPSVLVTEDLKDAINRLAERSGVPVSEIQRRALESYVTQALMQLDAHK